MINNKRSLWVKGYIIVCFSAIVLTGCGKKQDNINISKGMEMLEQYDYQGALENFEAAAIYEEDNQLLSRGEGLAYMGLGQYDKAQECFLESISYAGGNLTELEFDTNYYLAAAYMKQGKYAEAKEIYSAIIALRKKDVDAYYQRACVLLKEGNYEAALTDFEKAFSLAPSNMDLITDAYVEMKASGFTEEGKAYLQEYLKVKDKSLKDGQKGIFYYYLEDYTNARTYLDAFLNGNDAELSLILGKTYEKLGDMNYAAVVYETYLNGNVPSAAIYNSLGVCLMKQQKYGEALEAFEAGIELGSTGYLQDLKFNLIVANEYLGNFAQAKTLMQEYLAAYPDDEKAKRESVFLETR